MGKNIININGKEIITNGGTLSIINGKIFVDGKEYTDEIDTSSKEIKVVIEGNVGNIEVGGDLELNGNVLGNLSVKGSIVCNDVKGDINCYGNLKSSMITGAVKAGGNVKSETINGNVTAGGNISSKYIVK